MPLKILVCVKPVPKNADVTIDPLTKTVRRDASESVISTLDKCALEFAAQLKKQQECEVTVLSMAPASAEINIREALARGGDRAVILSDRAFAGGDTYTTSYTLSEAVKKLGGFDLILTGAASDDGGTAQLASQLAEWLNIPHLHNAQAIELSDSTVKVESTADGKICSWSCSLPVLISVGRGLNHPGPAGVRSILQAKRKELSIWSAKELETLNPCRIGLKNAPTQNGQLYPLKLERNGRIVEGTAEEIADALLAEISRSGIRL